MEKYIKINVENLPDELRSGKIDDNVLEVIEWLESEYQGYEFHQMVAPSKVSGISGFFILKHGGVTEKPPILVVYAPMEGKTTMKVREDVARINKYISEKIPKGWVYYVLPDRHRLNFHVEHINPDHMVGKDYDKFKKDLEGLNQQVREQFEKV